MAVTVVKSRHLLLGTEDTREGSDEEKILLPTDTSVSSGYVSLIEYVHPIPGTEGTLRVRLY